MKLLKRNFIISIVACAIFCLISTGIMQPVQTATAMQTISNPSYDMQQISETTTIISMGDISITTETLENGYRISTVLDDGEILTYEITTELRSMINTTLTNTSKIVDTPVEKIMLINGTEFVMSNINTLLSQPFESSNNPPNTRGQFMWDGIVFNGKNATIDYPHPDRNYYDINARDRVMFNGIDLCHFQIGKIDAAAFMAGGIPAISGAVALEIANLLLSLGTIVEGMVNSLATILTAVFIGILVFAGYSFLDESGALWLWVSKNFVDWIGNNALWLTTLLGIQAPIIATAELKLHGYFRIGDWTPCNGLGMANPGSQPHYYVDYVQQYTVLGYGAVENPNGIVGSSLDGSETVLYGGNYKDGGHIVGHMNVVAHGTIWVYVRSCEGYYSHFYTYVSYNNNYTGHKQVPNTFGVMIPEVVGLTVVHIMAIFVILG